MLYLLQIMLELILPLLSLIFLSMATITEYKRFMKKKSSVYKSTAR